MLKKILIANRGEIALRIIRACKEMQIKTVAIYSTADKDQIHVKYADEAVCIGGVKSADSYLNMDSIILIAKAKACDGIHPGYGFLSENADFVEKVEKEGITFIGPKSLTIRLMGDKISARKLMAENNVPVVPGSPGQVEDIEEAFKIADKIGYPVLIKASGGGGGKGMRPVFTREELEEKFLSAQREAMAAFQNKSMYIEKLILNPRHIEVQVLSDHFGNTIALAERNCSIQRKNQKMIEEAPAFGLSEEVRKKLRETAILAAQACDYKNAGTVEFVMDKDEKFFFIEMNTRLQVEHPVTEMVTGIDLVKEQIRIASGMRLPCSQEEVQIIGHSIECRINAEDPLKNFMPQSGTVQYLYSPSGPGTRFDSHLFNGVEISPFYDSMIGKVIVHERTRMGAIRKMRRALDELIVGGIKINMYLQYAILFEKDFIRGSYDTSFINQKLEGLLDLMEANK